MLRRCHPISSIPSPRLCDCLQRLLIHGSRSARSGILNCPPQRMNSPLLSSFLLSSRARPRYASQLPKDASHAAGEDSVSDHVATDAAASPAHPSPPAASSPVIVSASEGTAIDASPAELSTVDVLGIDGDVSLSVKTVSTPPKKSKSASKTERHRMGGNDFIGSNPKYKLEVKLGEGSCLIAKYKMPDESRVHTNWNRM